MGFEQWHSGAKATITPPVRQTGEVRYEPLASHGHFGQAVSAFNHLRDTQVSDRHQRLLGDFLLTAYAVNPESTGKPVTAPDYGITFSGTTAQVNRTVAVDPKIIPLGTPIYIEGIGWRLAEDIGGAVKGHHIDVLVPTESDAVTFGVKRHVKVYAPITVP